jgi:hypothetical protein
MSWGRVLYKADDLYNLYEPPDIWRSVWTLNRLKKTETEHLNMILLNEKVIVCTGTMLIGSQLM